MTSRVYSTNSLYTGEDCVANCRVDGICGSGQSGTVKNGGVENAGVDNAAPLWQGSTMQEWSEVTKAAYKITSIANDSLYI